MEYEETAAVQTEQQDAVYEEAMYYANLSFMTADFQKAVEYGKQARTCKPKEPEVYELIAKSYQAMGDAEQAIPYFQKAVSLDASNGDRYIELGVAYGSAGKSLEALEQFAKAQSEGRTCSEDYLGSMYRTIAMADYDLGRYDDAAINFVEAQKYLQNDVDVELLLYLALSYSMNGKLPQAMQTVRRIKQIAPSSYDGYQMMFTYLMHEEQLEEARAELKQAQMCFAENDLLLPMDYYFDRCEWELARYQQEQNAADLVHAITALEEGLHDAHPTISDVVNACMKAADIYLQLVPLLADEATRQSYLAHVIQLLDDAFNHPARSYNHNLSLFPGGKHPHVDFRDSTAVPDVLDMDIEMLEAEAERRKAEKLPSEAEYRQSRQDAAPYTLDEAETVQFPEETYVQIYMLYAAAYTAMHDYEKVICYAKKLKYTQANAEARHTGMYLEVKATMDSGKCPEKIPQMYEALIEAYRLEAIKDPTALSAITYRVQCYLDTGQFHAARKFCEKLPANVKKPLLQQIGDAETAS